MMSNFNLNTVMDVCKEKQRDGVAEMSLTSCDPNVCPHSIFPALLQLLRSWPCVYKVGILNF